MLLTQHLSLTLLLYFFIFIYFLFFIFYGSVISLECFRCTAK